MPTVASAKASEEASTRAVITFLFFNMRNFSGRTSIDQCFVNELRFSKEPIDQELAPYVSDAFMYVRERALSAV